MSHYENFSLPLHSTATCLANGIKRFFNLYCDHSITLEQAEATLYPEQLDYYLGKQPLTYNLFKEIKLIQVERNLCL